MQTKKVKYYLNQNNQFVIENYNLAKPFANFFPGIAGIYGTPMWAFLVNRCQCISSFGTRDKDHAIMEFNPANKSWQSVSSLGFRTFIKVNSGTKNNFYEPFHNGIYNSAYKIQNKMSFSAAALEIEESNATLGLNTKVEYFTIPNDSYAALVRIVSVKNTTTKPKTIQLLDGMPQIVPFGTNNFFLKEMSRTIEGWMQVDNLERGVPFYRLAVDPSDRPEVIHIKEGNFYLGFHYENEAPQALARSLLERNTETRRMAGRMYNSPKIITPITDPQDVFGPVTDFSYPAEFIKTARLKAQSKQLTTSKTPCAFLNLNIKLKKGEEKTFYALIGYMRNIELLNSSIPRITKNGYIESKKEQNKTLIDGLMQDIKTESSSREFNLYAQQTYLDNIMRGGYPLIFRNGDIFYLYSRKHGDLERDYNRFFVQPTYFSQGNGNYRDANQNRRSDVWFHPEVKDENVVYFLNLLQTDGFNPLVIKGSTFALKDLSGFESVLHNITDNAGSTSVLTYLSKPFTPGDVIIFLEDHGIKLRCTNDEFLDILIGCSVKYQEAEHGEGFWTDHWVYNLDLLDSYFGVYPDKKKELTFEKKVFTFFDNTEIVKPRQEKYVLRGGAIKQLHSIHADNAKKELIKKRATSPHVVRSQNGCGEIYYTNLFNKLLCLAACKLASLDPFGMGIEMEADKPNWYDSLNGLPGLLGSSLNETFELKRLLELIKELLVEERIEVVKITKEVIELLEQLDALINEYFDGLTDNKDYNFWDKCGLLKDAYRQKTKLGLCGDEVETSASRLIMILNSALRKVDAGIEKAYDKQLYCGYFINEVTKFEELKDHFVKPTEFIQKKLPLFLEPQVHALKVCRDKQAARLLHKATKASPLYDKKLKMYKVTAALKSMPEEIGRCRVFTPGWLENESIWLHMEYKYLLGLLKNGLADEFYQEFKNTLIPFQKASRYGRSILENSSFLVSSAFPDKKMHGNGFVARLSGSTAEFLSIWLLMNTGRKPFFLNERNELNLRFSPILGNLLFKRNNSYSFNFLSKVLITYHNPKKKDTFGKNSVKPVKITFNDKDGKSVEIFSDTITSPYAEQVRLRLIKQIDIYLG